MKGAAALAVQESVARRASSQSQGESSGTSDVDSPAPPTITHLATPDGNQPSSSKSPRPESSSPILTSMLNSPSSIQTSIASGELTHIKANSTTKSASDPHSSPLVIVDSPKHLTASKEQSSDNFQRRVSKEDTKQHADETQVQKERSLLQEQNEELTYLSDKPILNGTYIYIILELLSYFIIKGSIREMFLFLIILYSPKN